jgi:hypothetical protein
VYLRAHAVLVPHGFVHGSTSKAQNLLSSFLVSNVNPFSTRAPRLQIDATRAASATGIDHAAAGILAHAMQSMAIRRFIAHNRESGAYALTVSGRATLTAIIEDAGLK